MSMDGAVPLRTILLMPQEHGSAVENIAEDEGVCIRAEIVNDLQRLVSVSSEPADLLLSFCSGVIVPEQILATPSLVALNVHTGSPQFPGRDPHHFAIYSNATRFGATLHFMESSVDAGPIVDVELFDVPRETLPCRLLELATEAGWTLIRRFFRNFALSGTPMPVADLHWGTKKTTRKMFLDLCRIDPAMTEAEILRRINATSMPGYNNTFVDICGYRFRIEGPAS